MSEPENQGDDIERDEHVAVYLRFRRVFGDATGRSATARKRKTKKEGASVPFGAGRDPHGIGDVMDVLAAKMGWTSPLAKSELLSSWASIVGEETAEHSEPVSIEEGVLETPQDADLGAVYGWGFPAWTGGTLSYIDTVGIAEFVREADRLAQLYGARFAPSAWLRDKAARNEGFYDVAGTEQACAA